MVGYILSSWRGGFPLCDLVDSKQCVNVSDRLVGLLYVLGIMTIWTINVAEKASRRQMEEHVRYNKLLLLFS